MFPAPKYTVALDMVNFSDNTAAVDAAAVDADAPIDRVSRVDFADGGAKGTVRYDCSH